MVVPKVIIKMVVQITQLKKIIFVNRNKINF